jgi:hypothetical protein
MSRALQAQVRAQSPSLATRAWSAPLWAHAAGLALILAALLPLMSPSSSFTSDEGAYALQVRALERGSWAYEYRGAPLDPDGSSFPIVLSSRNGDTFYPYVKHPAYVMLLRGASALLGETVGLHLLGLLGAVGTAVAAWLLAGEVDNGFRRPAFWMAAASPTLGNGYVLWAHSLSAAVAGLTVLAAVRTVRHGMTTGRLTAIAAGSAAGVLLRSEALLFAAALAAVTAMAFRRAGRSFAAAGGTFAVVMAPAAVAALVERAWVRSIVGDAYQNLETRAGGGNFLATRGAAIWHDLFAWTDIGLIGFVVLLGFTVVALRRWDSRSLKTLAVGAVASCSLVAVQWIRFPAETPSGLFAAWPLALVGLAVVPWRTAVPAAGAPVVRLLAGSAGLFAVAVVATEYEAGGGLQYGGRFYLPLVVPLAVLAVVGVDHAVRHAASDRAAATALLVIPSLLVALAGVSAVGAVRSDHRSITAAVARHPAPVTVTTIHPLPRVAWSVDDRVTWMLTEDHGLAAQLTELRERGIREVAVVTGRDVPPATLSAYRHVSMADEPALARKGVVLLLLRA